MLRIGLSLVFFISCWGVALQPDTVAVWLLDERKGAEAADSSKHGHTVKAIGKVDRDTGKLGQAAKCKPGAYFEVPHADALNLSTFIITAWVKFLADTGGGEQNILYKQVGKDRVTRNHTGKIWEGQVWAIFPSGGNTNAVELGNQTKVADGN